MPVNKLKILKLIPTVTADNKALRKAFETFFLLKHHVVEGEVYGYSSKSAMLSELCCISTRTFYTRLELMRKAGLVKTKKGKLVLASWDAVCKKYNVRKNFYYIREDIYENTKVEYIIEAKTIQEAQKRRANAFYAKIACNRFAEAEYRNITGFAKTSRRAILEYVIDCFKNPSKYNEDERYFLLSFANPDEHLSAKAISSLINGRMSASMGTYTKRKLMRNKLASLQHRIIQSNELPREAIQGKVYYSRAIKKTILILADKLDVI